MKLDPVAIPQPQTTGHVFTTQQLPIVESWLRSQIIFLIKIFKMNYERLI